MVRSLLAIGTVSDFCRVHCGHVFANAVRYALRNIDRHVLILRILIYKRN